LFEVDDILKLNNDLCRNLVALNDDSDPGWEAIIHMKKFLIDKIKASYQQFVTEEQTNETPSKSLII